MVYLNLLMVKVNTLYSFNKFYQNHNTNIFYLETLLLDAECPQDARIAAKGKHCMLAYKRIDAKIAWPTMNPMPSATLPNY